MLWVILVIQIVTLGFVLGLVGAVSELTPSRKKKTSHSFLDDEELVFEELEFKPKRKRAVKQATSLKKAKVRHVRVSMANKRSQQAQTQKRVTNGRFA